MTIPQIKIIIAPVIQSIIQLPWVILLENNCNQSVIKKLCRDVRNIIIEVTILKL